MNKISLKDMPLIVFFLYFYMRCSLTFLGINEGVTSFLILTLLVLYQLLKKRCFIIKKNNFWVFVLICGFIGLSCMLNRAFSNLDLGVILQWVICLVVTSTFSKDEFYDYFLKSMYFIAVSSIVGLLIWHTIPGFVNLFPLVTNMKWFGGATNLRNLYICLVDTGSTYQRNFGIFYEPGMYAFYLNLAIFILLFKKESIDVKKFIVLVIALLTTTSTNGYISLTLLVIIYFTSRKSFASRLEKKMYKNTKKMLIVLTVVIIFLAVYYFYANPARLSFLTSKLFELNMSSTSGSGFERFRAIRLSIEAFLLNPVVGLSVTGISNYSGSSITTFTPMQWFATYGLVYGLLCNVGYAKVAIDRKNKTSVNLMLCVTIFTMIVSQNLTTNGVMVALLMYSFLDMFKTRKRRSVELCI